MKKPIILLFICLIVYTNTAFTQASLNMELLALEDPASVSYNEVWGYNAPSGKEIAIIGSRTHIYFYDVTKCYEPQLLLTFTGGENNTWRDFKTYGHYAYGVCDSCNEGIHIFDLSDIDNGIVTHVNTVTSFFGSAHNIYIEEATGKLYGVGVPGSTDVSILDLTVDPANPSLIANLDLAVDVPMNTCSPCYVHDIYVKNDIAYANHGWEESYSVYDLSDPSNPEFLNTVAMGNGYNHSSWTDAEENYAYVAVEVPSGVPMQVVDLSNLNDPLNDLSVVNTFIDPETDDNPTPHNPFVKDDYLYISYYTDGLKVYDITDRVNPEQIAFYDTAVTNANGAWGTYPFLDSGCLLISDMNFGLHTVQADIGITDTCTPVISRTGVESTPLVSASNYLSSNAIITTFSEVIYSAEDFVELTSGFATRLGDFEVKIDQCTSNN